MDKFIAFAAWHPQKGFDAHHYEGPFAFADLDHEGVLEIVDDLNDMDGTTPSTGWRAVKVVVVKIP